MYEMEQERKNCLKNCRKFLRVIIFSILFICLIYAGYTFTYKFFVEKPTYTSTRIVPQHDAKFPALSICPTPKGYKDEFLKKNGITDGNCYYNPRKCQNGTPDWTGNNSDLSPREMFSKSIMKQDEVLNEVHVRFLYAHEKFNNSKQIKGEELKMLKRSHHRLYGYCFTFYPDESYRKAGIYYIKIDVKVPAKIHLHEEHQFLAFNGRLGHTVNLGEKNHISLNIHDIEQLQRIAHHKHDDLPDTTFEHHFSCSSDSFDACMYDRLTKEMILQTDDNCSVPWYPPLEHLNGTICSKEKDINLSTDIHFSRFTNAKKDCNEPCRVLLLSQAGKNYQGRNETWNHGLIYFYFSATSFQSIEHFLYPLEILVAEFGGYMGLLLGLSILDISFKIIDIIG